MTTEVEGSPRVVSAANDARSLDRGSPSRIVRVARPDSLPSPADRFVVVEASAGTGKTFFLEHRVIDLILGVGAELSQILLVTFTDKAVAELRMRIRDLLDRTARAEVSSDAASAWELDDAARARLRSAVTAFDHAPIFTIHGFCHRILIEDAFAARRLFDQKQVADEVAFDTAFGSLLRERFARTSPDRELLAAYLEWSGTVDNLRDLLLKCARADAQPPRRYDPEEALEVFAALREALGTPAKRDRLLTGVNWKGQQRYAPGWVDAIGRAIDAVGGASEPVAERPAPALRIVRDDDPFAPTRGSAGAPPPATRRVDPAAVLGALDSIRTEVGKIYKYAQAAAHLADVAAALRAALRTIPLDAAVAAELLPHVIDRIGTDKAEHGMFDYDDMLELVRDALHGPRGGELAARLRARMPWVMIDEFQDTDPVQWDIFRTVWMEPSARGLTIVGDPKQAIYGFRGADVQTYVHARDELVRNGATEVMLDVNRRSTKPLVDAINAILAGPPLSPLLDKTITYDHPVKASGDVTCETVRPPVTVFHMQGGNRDDNRNALAREIGIEVERLRAAPPVWQSRGNAPPFSLGHVMVLTRSNKESVGIAAALRSRGLACALVESDKLFATREAAELAAVLDAIAAPRDRSHRMRALRTRFFDVPWTELMRVVDAPDHHPLIARLFDWAALAARRDYEPLFRRLVEDSRFAERALVLGGGERALVNTWHLIELLLEEVARSRCDLSELVGRLRRWINEQEELADDRDIQRAETDADAIRILTIHKAKGLEAPYVFLFGCASPGPRSKVEVLRDGAGRTLWVSTQDETIKQRIESESDAENQRLAYVALTRAQVRLYLPLYSIDNKVVDPKSTYQPIQRCLTPLVQQRSPLVEIVETTVDADPDPPAPADALAGFDVPAPPQVAELAALPASRTALAMLSYTRLAKNLDAAALVPGELPQAIDAAEFAIYPQTGEPQVELDPTELPPGADSGLLLHDIFEHADFASLRGAATAEAWHADPEVAALIADKARERGIAAQYLPHAARLVHATLTQPLALVDGSALPALVDSTAFARELEFTYPIPSPGAPTPRGLVKGFIDVLVAYGDDLWVLDYKSDLLLGPDFATAAKARAKEHYSIQARLYAIAADKLRGGRRFAGLLFAFVRYGVVVPMPVDDSMLGQWSSWLANLRTEIPR